MEIYQHFRKEEQPFIDQVLSWKEQVEGSYIARLTDFLDPREQQIVAMIIGENNADLKLYASGASEFAERKRMLIAPYYEEITEESYQITLLEAAYHEKFITLEHRDVMGAFLSQGIKRDKLGDIIVGNGRLQIILADEISQYVIMNLTSVKHAKIKLQEIPLSNLVIQRPNWVESTKTVSSMRLDALLKEIYHISRKDAQVAIEKLQVKVNHKVVQDNKFQLQEGDLLSLRGKGRSKLLHIDGQTRKEKWRVTTAILQ
ncbi:RNA-binding protein [Oceanobacillus sp. FSL H7-0719]|uniref:YlmH family RNA-binding protein n=1 Tax=Oceanobacillus sp. FSL H7-0719 TaxID=2954507 RepID=UPI003253AC4C